MDKAYVDFKRLYRIHSERAYFVVRAKTNLDANIVASRDVKEGTGILSDQTIVLAGQTRALSDIQRSSG